MASTDHNLINVRERPLSTDINDIQALTGRSLVEVLQFLLYNERINLSNPLETGGPEGYVLGGLTVSGSGANASISPGVLLQNNAALLPAPGPLDSNIRLATQRSVVLEPAPTPGSDTYYLLEARMAEVVVTSPSRDVLDPVTGNFVATTVPKLHERRLEFRWRAGTADAAPATVVGWIPLAVIFRPAAGGNVLTSHVQDARPIFDFAAKVTAAELSPTTRSVEFTRSYLATQSRIPGDNSLLISLDMVVRDSQGRVALAKSNGFVDVSIFDRQTGITFPGTNNTVRYLYLAHAPHPVSHRYAGVAHRGYLVVSNVAPSLDNVNSAAIPVVGVAGGSIGQGSAVCIGVLRSNGTGWYPMSQVGRRVSVYRLPTTPAGALPSFTFSGAVPANAKIIDCRLNATLSGGGAGAIFVTEPGASSSTSNAFELVAVNGTTTQEVSTRVTVPATQQGGDICTVHVAIATATAMTLEVMGWEF